MKGTKQEKQTLLQNAPVLDYLPPGLKKKRKVKYETEPMVLMASDAPEKFAQYAIEIPSVNKDRVLDEMDMLKNITVHLNQIVQTMEHVYTMDDKIKEEGEEEEETLPHEREDMISFLVFCSQLSNQVDAALREERQILESLLKWFEKEVQLLEELGEEEIIPDWQVPVADKNITDNINKLINRIQRLEDLKGRVQELPRYIRASTPREKRRPLAPPPPALKDPKNIVQELALKHATEDVMNMVQVFQDDSGAPQTIESMSNRMVEIMKIFERQTNKLHRVSNEQDVLEGKLKKIQHDFQKLAEEKRVMEDELQKMKASDTTQDKGSVETRKALLAKLEKEKATAGEKTAAQPEKVKRPVIPQKVKEHEAVKMKGDLAKAQANIQSLEKEKKMLEEKLQKVLEEADMAKGQLAEIPPSIPDWGFPYAPFEEPEKDLSKKSKKGTKLKSKASVTDGTVQKVTRFESAKAGEALPGKGQEISISPQAKDGKSKKKGADLSEIERSSLHKTPSSVSEKLSKHAGKSEITDSKGLMKPKESVEIKKRRSGVKGAKKEPALPPLPPDQEKQQLPDSTDQQAESVEITSEKQEEMLPAEESEPEAADLVYEPEEFVGESERDEIKDLIDEGMLQLVDHLTELKGMPEAETLAKLLLEPGKSMEALSDKQKLQLINQLIALGGQEQVQFLIPVEGQLVGKMDEEEREKRRRVLANIASTLKLLDQPQAEAGQSEEEVNEMARMSRLLLADLESDLKDLQPAPSVIPIQQDLEKKINQLTQKRSLLSSALDSNLEALKEAQAIAATQPSEMSKNKVKELLQERAALTACMEANEQDMQRAKSQEAVLAGKVKHEKEVNELSEKKGMLLAELEKNLNELQEVQALAAMEPSSMSDEKIKELTEQRKQLTASLETILQGLERAHAYKPDLAEESRLKQEEVNELSEKRKTLLANLKSNLKDLEEAQALAAIEPSAENEEKIKELTEQKKLLAASLETNLQDLQRAQGYVPDLEEESRLKQMELNEQSEKKRLLQEKLELNLKNLQQAQMLAATHPNSANEVKLHELIEERQNLTKELEAAVHVIQGIQREKELNELSEKKQLLLKNLESNLNELKEAQALAAAEPGGIADHKLQELTEQRRHLAADLDATLHHMEEVQHQDKMVKNPEVELQELSGKKQLLLEKLESTLRELQQAQAVASTEKGSPSEHKIQELTEQRKQLTAELEAAILDMQEIQLRDEILKASEKEVQILFEKKQVLLADLVSTLKELKKAQVAAAADPGSISEEKLRMIRERGRRLIADLEATVHNLKKAQHRASGRAETDDRKLRDWSENKQFLLQNLKSNLKELEEVQALADSEDILTEDKIQPLNEQRKLVTASLDTVIQQIKETEGRRVPQRTRIPFVLNRDLDQLSQYKRLFLESLESNLRDLQAAQAVAAVHPGSITEQKVQELTEQRRLWAAGLKAIIEDIAEVENQASVKDAILRTREIILEELYQKQQLILENLESNSKDLEQAEALAASYPGAMSENKIKELIEQRRLLATGLETIMQGIQEADELDRDKLEILEIIERELADLSEKRKELWKNLELNLNDLKGLQILADTEPDTMPDEKKQMLAEQRKSLAANLEALVQDMEDAQSVDLSGGQMASPEGRNINDLFEIKRLESKLDEMQQIRAISDVQLNSIKRKLCDLKAKRGLDKWGLSLQGPLALTKEELAAYGLDDKAARKLLGQGRYLASYLQKSFRDLQQKSSRDLHQKSIILQGASYKGLHEPKVDQTSLKECLVSVPLKILEEDTTVKNGADHEQQAKRRALVAKLEANMKELQAFYEAQKTRAGEKPTSKTSSSIELKPTKSHQQLQISKVPAMEYQEKRKSIPRHDILVPIGSETSSTQLQQPRLQKRDMELELRKQFIQQLKKTTLPYELIIQKRDMDGAMQEILDSNKVLLPAHKANLPEVLAQSQLQQANLAAAQKLLYSHPAAPGTAEFYDYSPHPPRPAWEANQFPATDYIRKLIILKNKLLSPEMKGLLDILPPSTTRAPSSSVRKMDSMLIRGKGYTGSGHEIHHT